MLAMPRRKLWANKRRKSRSRAERRGPVTDDLTAKTNAVQASHLDRIVFAIRSVTLVHARGMGGAHLDALREALCSMHSADRHPRSELRKSICNTTVAGGQSCRVWR